MWTAHKTKINANGRVVIPAAMRAELGVKPGDEVLMRVEDGEVRVYTLDHAIKRAQAFFRQYVKPGEESWTDALIRERREEARKEAREAAADRRRATARAAHK